MHAERGTHNAEIELALLPRISNDSRASPVAMWRHPAANRLSSAGRRADFEPKAKIRKASGAAFLISKTTVLFVQVKNPVLV